MAELPKRKRIRLENYDYSQNNAYFVTICTHGRQRLFGYAAVSPVGAHPCVRPSAAGEMVEKWINKTAEKFPEYIIEPYIIMPDHIHLIIIICGAAGGHAGPPLQDVIRWFKTQTTNEYIRGVKSGIYPPYNKKIWQRSFYDHIIRNSSDMTETVKYIYDNPLKWYAEHKEENQWN